MRLPDPQHFGGLRLGEATLFDDAIDLERQFRLQQFLVSVWQTKVREHVTTAFGNALGSGSFRWGFSFQS